MIGRIVDAVLLSLNGQTSMKPVKYVNYVNATVDASLMLLDKRRSLYMGLGWDHCY